MSGTNGYYPDNKITGPTGNYLAVNSDGSINVAGATGSSTNAPKYVSVSSASSARTTSGSTGAVTFTGTPRFVSITINVTAIGGTSPTVQWFAQTSDANGNQIDVFSRIAAAAPIAGTQLRFTFGPDCPNVAHTVPTAAGIVAVTSAPCILSPTGSVNLGWVLGGTSPSITFQYGIQQLY